MLIANLIGMGLGPQIVGFLSDGLRPTIGNELVFADAEFHKLCTGNPGSTIRDRRTTSQSAHSRRCIPL
jgi:hypothetical protein